MLFRVILYAVVPEPNKNSKKLHSYLVCIIRDSYYCWWLKLRDEVIAWHQAELKRQEAMYS